MADWRRLVVPGETRLARVSGTQLLEMRIVRDGDGVQAGARLEGRLATKLGRRGIVDLGGEEAVIEPWPAGATEGARLMVDVCRAAWREPGRDRLAKVRAVRDGKGEATLHAPAATDDWPEWLAEQWADAFEAARLGAWQAGPARLGFVPTPAFTAVDVDGAGPDLAVPAVEGLAHTIRLWGLGGSILIDLPGPLGKAGRTAAAAAFDAAMGDASFERTGVNGFGLMQVICPRPGPSILERARLEPAANAAIALLEAAGCETRPGALRLVLRPDAARWIEARPHLLADLRRAAGRAVDVAVDPVAGEGHVETSA